MHNKVIYEQPLNERVRTFLRLEFLFKQARHYLQGEAVWNSRAALTALLDILNIVAGKTDLKTEILKELERHTAYLGELEGKPGVDRGRLTEILDDLETLLDALHGSTRQIGQELRQNDFLNSIRQRSTLPGGTCDFDIPAYHHWLQSPAAERNADLAAWFDHLDIVEQSISLIMHLIRGSTVPKQATAEGGFYLVVPESAATCQLVRIILPADAGCFPEISGGKHRVTIRFMEQAALESRPVAVSHDVAFELTCCTI